MVPGSVDGRPVLLAVGRGGLNAGRGGGAGGPEDAAVRPRHAGTPGAQSAFRGTARGACRPAAATLWLRGHVRVPADSRTDRAGTGEEVQLDRGGGRFQTRSPVQFLRWSGRVRGR